MNNRRPNLLLVFSDPQSWDMLGCYGNASIQTPHLDRFAESAVRFNHCVANAPVCTPSRGILLSGPHPLRNGAVFNDWQMLPGNGDYFAERLHAAGYRTGYIGKWHLYGGDRDRSIPAGPLRYGFHDRFLSNHCALEFRAVESHYWSEDGERLYYDKWEPDAQTDHALDFIDACERDYPDRPWALFVSWHAPHNCVKPGDDSRPSGYCYDAPQSCMDRYDPETISLRPIHEDNDTFRRMYHGCYALCSNLDDNFQRLRTRIEQSNAEHDTVTVYTLDHGDRLEYRHGELGHKRNPKSTSSRVPLLLRAPGFDPRVSDLLVGTLDPMPTLLSLLDVKPPETCDGTDLATAIREADDQAVASQPLWMSSPQGCDWRGVYTQQHPFSFGASADFQMLFDRDAEPWETHNRHGDDAYAGIQRELHDLTRS